MAKTVPPKAAETEKEISDVQARRAAQETADYAAKQKNYLRILTSELREEFGGIDPDLVRAAMVENEATKILVNLGHFSGFWSKKAKKEYQDAANQVLREVCKDLGFYTAVDIHHSPTLTFPHIFHRYLAISTKPIKNVWSGATTEVSLESITAQPNTPDAPRRGRVINDSFVPSGA